MHFPRCTQSSIIRVLGWFGMGPSSVGGITVNPLFRWPPTSTLAHHNGSLKIGPAPSCHFSMHTRTLHSSVDLNQIQWARALVKNCLDESPLHLLRTNILNKGSLNKPYQKICNFSVSMVLLHYFHTTPTSLKGKRRATVEDSSDEEVFSIYYVNTCASRVYLQIV